MNTSMSDPIIVINHLRKVYEPFSKRMKLLLRSSIKEPVVALDDFSLEVFPGEIRAVLGPNGAGKSTLFRVITGLTTPTAGSATVMGLDATRQSASVRRMVGFMPAESHTLLLRHSCRENLSFHGRLQGIPSAELHDRIDETLEMVGLGDAKERVGFALSSGMLARLMFARALLHKPPVLILDEPTGAVDPIGSYELLGLIQEIARENGLAVLISSHRLDEVEMLNDKVLLLNKGRIVFSGDLSEMVRETVKPKIEITVDSPEVAEAFAGRLRAISGVTSAVVDGATITVTSEISAGRIVEEIDGEIDRMISIGAAPPKLRDVLGELLGEAEDEMGRS